MAIAQAALLANQNEVEVELGPHAPGDLRVLSFEADERLSHPFEITVTLAVPPDLEVDPQELMGERANLYAQLGDGTARHFDGIVRKVRAWDDGRGTGEAAPRLRVTIVPRLWRLGRIVRSRIFQEKSVPDIVAEVLDAGQVEVRTALSGSYEERTFCVQYGESDLAFVSRLMEEEGIFYFFEHAQGSHVMVLADAATAYAELQGGTSLPFREKSQLTAAVEYADAFAATRELRSSKIALRDFNERRPTLDLTSEAEAGDAGEAEADLELYEYPGGYTEPGVGRSLSKVHLERERARTMTFTGSSICRRLCPGSTFVLEDHPLLSGEYVVVSVSHRGSQIDYAPEPGTPRAEVYRNDFVCVKNDVPFRPERVTPKPLIAGAQTAVVVGPPGEEIHTDDLGRIKIQFHWDREGKKNDRSSCWVRVSQAWAGPGWGALYLPRIGHEVVVEFLEGDPDRPLVTGSVYNGTNPPPISLPDEKTRSTLKSASSPGSGGNNELRFEDAAGSEEIWLHAQKDLQIVVENDKTQSIGGNESLTVDKDRTKGVGGNHTTTVDKDDTATIGGNQALTIGGNRSTKIGGAELHNVIGDQSIAVGGAHNLLVGLASAESVGAGKMLNVGGAYSVNVGGLMNELVGGMKTEEVGGAKVEIVKGKKTEIVMNARSMKVGGDYQETVDKSRTLKVAKNVTVNVKGKHQQVVKKTYKLKAKEIVLDAEDQFTLKVGNATLQVKKNGDVVVKGAKIQVNAKGEMVLKASKISEA